MKHSFLFKILILLCSFLVHAEESISHISQESKKIPIQAFNIQISKGSDSDLWESDQLRFVSPHILSDLSWPYNSEPDYFFDFAVTYAQSKKTQNSFSYSVREFSTDAIWKYSKSFQTQFQIGLAESKNETSSSRTIGTGEAQLLWHTEDSDFQVQFKKHLASEWILATSSWMQSQTGWSFHPSWSLKTSQDSKLQIKLERLWLSDDNERKKLDLDWKYGISLSPIWFWIGPGFERTQYQKTLNEYWSPTWVESKGLRYDFALPIGDKFQFQSGGSIHQISSSESDSGQGHYLRTGISYGNREDFQISFSHENILSRQSSGEWKSSLWEFRLQWTLN
jgi:hypothetical protein